ncbi:hypothetical protein L5515_007500 [Caenorhabditis briggsae]|uniref:Uncharacterized protein n=1 Tax=Caenorhabditis briggsae TaxID=6238 RepID=A0AAE9F368_CAEBR|nr:hypothetical protein L5515_007500 [Caenorhabditis briggsae]
MKTEKALGVTQSKRELPRTGARKKEKDNDGEKPNRKTPEKDQQILKRKIENLSEKPDRMLLDFSKRQIISPLPSLAPFLNFY